MDQIKVQVIFTSNTKHGEYRDALYFTEEEYSALTQEQIDAMKQARADAWVDFRDNPPAVPEPTKEELEALLEEGVRNEEYITEQKSAYQTKLDAINSK